MNILNVKFQPTAVIIVLFANEIGIKTQNAVFPNAVRAGGCVCVAVSLTRRWKFVPMCKPCPASPTTPCEM